jgi:hypothetical protein
MNRGYFEFRLCPQNDPLSPVKQSCLDTNLLEIVQQSKGTKYFVKRNVNEYRLSVKLPQGLTCSQCVLQWHYRAGKLKLSDNKFSFAYLRVGSYKIMLELKYYGRIPSIQMHTYIE